MTNPAAKRLLLVISALSAAPALAASYNWSNPDGGAMNVTTNWSPAGVPGSADTANLITTPTLTGFMTLNMTANQAIGSFVNGHFAQNTIEGPGVLTLQTGTLNFTDSITEAPDEALNSLFINAVLNGAAGLTKSGPGFVRLGANNLYAGGTTINGGGVTVTSDANFGAAGSAITLNGGTIRAGSSFSTARNITLNSTGRIQAYGNLVLSGSLSGSGALVVERYTGGSVTISGTASQVGGISIANGATLNLTGRLANNGLLSIGGTLNLGSPTVGLASNAVSDLSPVSFIGGRLNVYAPAASATETLGNVSLLVGTSTINLEANANAGVALSINSIIRTNRSTAFIRGRDLGNGPLAANRAIVTVGGTLPLVGGGGTTATNDSIVPFLIGNSNVTGGFSQASVVDTGFVTSGANGLRALDATDYATSLTSGATNNVRITNSAITQNSAVTVNSLLLRDTLASGGPTGVGGSGTITITSGAIAAVSDLAGEELYIDNPIALGSAEGIIHTARTSDGFSSVTLRGAISGTGGLTKAGSGELTLTGTSSFTGGVVINAGLVNFEGSVGTGNSSLGGLDSNPITIHAGVTDNQYVGLRSMTPNAVISRNIVVLQNESGNSLGLLGTFGGYGTTYSGNVSIQNGYLNLFGDTEPEVMTLSGSVSGAGGLREPNLASPVNQYIRLTGNNTYSGGTIIRIGRWELGSNTALGTGTVFFTGESTSGSVTAFGGARTLANPFVFRATPTFGGTNALTLTGSIDLGSVARDIVVDNTADTSFAGAVSRGGIVKYGNGRLILSGVNTYNGQTIVSAGALRATTNSALGAATSDIRQATYITATGALELAGGITLDESINFGASGAPITIGRADGNLRNVNGTNQITAAVGFDNVGTLGVDSGSALTLSGDTLDNTSDNSARLRKVGTGQLTVKNVRLSGLQIDAGQVRVANAGAPLGTSRVSSLTISSGASLDLTNNALVLDYTTTSPLSSVMSLLLGDRIITSVPTTGAAVGYAETSRLYTSFPQSFAGQVIDGTTVLLIQTLTGDTNLDRTVNFDDLLRLAQNYGTTGKTWVDGDFDYNGTVDFDDLLGLAQTYGGTVSLTELSSTISVDFAADFARAMSLVPEPSSLALLTLAVLPRRRALR